MSCCVGCFRYFVCGLLTAMILVLSQYQTASGGTDEIKVSLNITNDSGGSTLSVQTGTRLDIQSTLTVNFGLAKPMMHVLQIKDPDDRVVFLSEIRVQIDNKASKNMEIFWPANGEGNHSVQALAWEDVRSPTAFAISSTNVRLYSVGPAVECLGAAGCLHGIVTRVIDGDTIDINGDTRIRLSLVDTPEQGEVGYEEAKSFTSTICYIGSNALVDEDDGQTAGSFGRVIGKLFCDGALVNEKLLESNHAVILGEFCEGSEFGLEDWAVRFGC